MVVRAGIDQEETESSDLKKKEADFEILVDHENLVTISCFRTFFNLHSILHPQFLHLF